MLLKKKISIWYFINLIKSQLLLISMFAVAIGILDLLPAFQKISLPLTIPALVGTAVSLLLAFRISQSYERWWEARMIWGAIVNDSRTFIRQITQALPLGSGNYYSGICTASDYLELCSWGIPQKAPFLGSCSGLSYRSQNRSH